MKTSFPLALSLFVDKYRMAAKWRISKSSPTGFTGGDLLLSRLGRHRLPFRYWPNAHHFPLLPPTSPPSCAPYTTPIPFHFPKSPYAPPHLDCKLPKPPALCLTHPGRLQGQAGNVRQAVTDIAQKKQCSMRKKTCLAWIRLKCTF